MQPNHCSKGKSRSGGKIRPIRQHKSQNFHCFKGKSRRGGKIQAIRLHKNQKFLQVIRVIISTWRKGKQEVIFVIIEVVSLCALCSWLFLYLSPLCSSCVAIDGQEAREKTERKLFSSLFCAAFTQLEQRKLRYKKEHEHRGQRKAILFSNNYFRTCM